MCKDIPVVNEVGDIDVIVAIVLVIVPPEIELRSVCSDKDERCVVDAVIVNRVLVAALLLAV